MIYEGSCDTEDRSNDAENDALLKWQFKMYYNRKLKTNKNIGEHKSICHVVIFEHFNPPLLIFWKGFRTVLPDWGDNF